MKRLIVIILIVIGVIALSVEARTAFAQAVDVAPASRCFPQVPARARLMLDGYQRVADGLVGQGAVLIEIWVNRSDGRFMILNVLANEDKLCIGVAGVNWQIYTGLR